MTSEWQPVVGSVNHVRASVLGAYLTVSLVWGSTYLAIRIGVTHLPPALLGGIRFVVAGGLLLAVGLALGRPLPPRREWMAAGVVGVLLLTVGVGLVMWAEQFVESGTAAILVVTSPLFMAIFDALIPGSDARPTWHQFVALAVGFAAIAVIVTARGALIADSYLPVAALIVSSASWALGSVYAKRRPATTAPHMHAALQMLVGGSGLLLVGLVTGEAAELRLSLPGVAVVLYLIVFGSLIAYTAYMYLLRHAQPAFVGTHVYLNTVVAVALGWLILDERVTVGTCVAMAIVLGAVIWVRRAERTRVATDRANYVAAEA